MIYGCCGGTREESLERIRREPFDLVLLDLMLPDGNGYSVCAAMKRESDIPVIFLTAMGDEESVVTGFELGADDYIAKPFRPLELVSRVKNVLRRSGRSRSVLRAGDLLVDTVKGTVTRDGQEIILSALEYRLLLVFLNRQGEVLTRNRLLEEIWDIAGDLPFIRPFEYPVTVVMIEGMGMGENRDGGSTDAAYADRGNWVGENTDGKNAGIMQLHTGAYTNHAGFQRKCIIRSKLYRMRRSRSWKKACAA